MKVQASTEAGEVDRSRVQGEIDGNRITEAKMGWEEV
jgi:hypothetical protein